MNRFVKRVLAKYVTYIETIGFVFVILFIAGLVALSFIKAEDEYVNLNGRYEIKSFLIKFDKRHYMVDILSDTNAYVSRNAPLLDVTADEKFIADQIILHNLEQQVNEAQKTSLHKIADQLTKLILEIEAKVYPKLKISTVRTPFAGDFFIMHQTVDLLDSNKIVGGVFDFAESYIRVTEFPADKRMKRKLKPGQTGTATLKFDPVESINIPVTLEKIDKNEAIIKLGKILIEDKSKIAYLITSHEGETLVDASISILVGWKSWMNLIWR